ncbi:unnamed protein product [Alopecurus aequalis]
MATAIDNGGLDVGRLVAAGLAGRIGGHTKLRHLSLNLPLDVCLLGRTGTERIGVVFSASGLWSSRSRPPPPALRCRRYHCLVARRREHPWPELRVHYGEHRRPLIGILSPNIQTPMEHSSEEESEISDSEIDEYKDKIYAQLRAGKPKVQYGEKTFRCPFCLGKKKQDYNGKDLLQHASGIGAASKRKPRLRAAHLALAEFVKNDLASSQEPSLQLAIAECNPPKKEEQEFVWPWMGILVNVPTDLKCANFVQECEDRLGSHLARFRPCRVIVKLDSNGQIDHSIIKFAEDWTGLVDAFAFEKHFIVEKYGKTDWNKINCRKDNLYGWIARSGDYNSPGTIGEHLRKIGVLEKISDREQEGTNRHVAHYIPQLEEISEHTHGLQLKINHIAMKRDRMLKDRDRLVEEHNEKMRKMQLEAARNLGKILADGRRLQQELERRGKQISQNHEKFEELARKSNMDRVKIEAEKQKNANENILLDLATLKKKKADEELMQLAEKHEQEKKDAFNRRYKLEKDLTSKQNLEMELAQLRGKLEVMKHLGAEADTTSKELEKISEELKEKDEQLDAMGDANQALIIVERRTNDELEQAKKELINGLQHPQLMSVTRSTIGVKRMGLLDKKSFSCCMRKESSK